MNYDQFIEYRNVKIRNNDHARIVKLFYKYLASVCGNHRLLPELIGKLTGIDLSSTTALTGCFNGIYDDSMPKYDNTDFYIKFVNGICIYVYASVSDRKEKELQKMNSSYLS